MCGVFGFDGRKVNLSTEKRAMLSAILAVANDGRGGDSWSIWTPKEIVRGLKEIAPNAYRLVKENFYFAHTRKATTGAATIENAHAFEIGNIILSHNGIITNHHELNHKYDRNYSVDSMHLAGHLNEGKDFGDISGYGTIEWLDKRYPNRIYLCRMSAGDLSIRGIGDDAKNVKGVVWSSDEDHLLAAVTTAKLKTFEYQIRMGQIYYVENGGLYYIDGQKLELGTSSYRDWRSGYSSSPHQHFYNGGDWEDEAPMHTLTPSSVTNEAKTNETVVNSSETKDEDKKKDETERKEYFQKLWDKEEDTRQQMLSDSGAEVSGIDSDEFTHTHQLNGDGEISEEEEFVKGDGFVGWRHIG